MNAIEIKLRQIIQNAVLKSYQLDLSLDDIVIENPKIKEHGDYSTNVAMQLAKQLKSNPRVIAQAIVEAIEKEDHPFTKLEIAGAGFINMVVKLEVLTDIIPTILKLDEKYGFGEHKEHPSFNIEYVSANPTGDLHPGHARGAAIGDALSRIMKTAGYNVSREYYINDAGNQINNMAKSLRARYLQVCGLEVEVPEDGYHGKDLIDIAQEIYDTNKEAYKDLAYEESVALFKKLGLEAEILKLKKDLELFRCEFDVWTSEQSLYDKGLVIEALEKLKSLGHTYEQEGALFLKTTDYGDDKDRVLIKSDGSYTYLMPDIAYHLNKKERGFDTLINLWGADHHGYIPRMKAALQALNYKPEDLHVDIIQMARMIKDGEEFKLSKRTGKAVALKDLIDEAGVDAVRYYFVSKAGDTHMDLDLDMASSSSNENPVYYAQYAHARMCSILRLESAQALTDYSLLSHEKERDLMMILADYPQWIQNSALLRQPHLMCLYIHKCASGFHSFYNECSVLKADDEALKLQRLALVKAVQITLRNALECIGVSAPEKM